MTQYVFDMEKRVVNCSSIPLDYTNIDSVRNRFIAFDVETTGGSHQDRIIELGAVVFENGIIVKSFSSLVNPQIPISKIASRKNHITDDMLVSAPLEEEIYPKFVEFLGDALNGKTVMCAHNASFDFGFLGHILSDLGYGGEIEYIDTLPLARQCLPELDNHKQGTLEAYFGLTNRASHRAVTDAEICGQILCRLMDIAMDSIEAEKKEILQKIELIKPKPRELEVCAFIQKIIADRGGNTKLLRFNHYSNCVVAHYYYGFLRFNFTDTGSYILVKKNAAPKSGYIIEEGTDIKSSKDYVRVYFSSPFDLEPLSDYIYELYMEACNAYEDRISYNKREKKNVQEEARYMYALSEEDVSSLLKTASENRHDITEFNNGYPYWKKGEEEKAAGRLNEAAAQYDKAKQSGYACPALYKSYADVYHQMQDYSNEIAVLNEGIEKYPDYASQWEKLKNKATKGLKQQKPTGAKPQVNVAKTQINQVKSQTTVNTPQPAAEPKAETPVKLGNANATEYALTWRNVVGTQKNFISIDIETTGYSPTDDRIIEIDAFVFQDGKIEKSFSSLVNPGIPVKAYASAKNYITDEMLASAPAEKEVYPKLIAFLGDALRGVTRMCAHNAKRVFDFLTKTFSRLGIDADIQYLDTISLAAKYLDEIEDYQLSTLGAYYGLTNPTSSRAASDAENCGHIFYRLLGIATITLLVETDEIVGFREAARPVPRAMEICAYIHKIVTDRGGNLKYLGYRCDNQAKGYVYASYFGEFFGFWIGDNGFYAKVPKDRVPDFGYIKKECKADYDKDFLNVYFASPFDLEPLSDYIYDLYMESCEDIKKYTPSKKDLSEDFRYRRGLSESEVATLLTYASEHRITNEEFVNGYHYWEQGEEAIKEERLTEAIDLFNKAKECRYYVPALYSSYALAYHRLKDYRSEIEILEEGIMRIPAKAEKWEKRINKAIQMLHSQEENERKALERAEKQRQREEAAAQPKQSQCKAIVQMDDDGNIIKIYDSLADASREVGVSSKCIRSAATGVQKHAGGFRWAYKEDMVGW